MLSEMALPRPEVVQSTLNALTERLNPWSYPSVTAPGGLTSDQHAALTSAERVRLRVIIDVIAAVAYGLDGNDLKRVLQDVDLPTESLARSNPTLDPCGFWRVDRSLNPERRHTVLTLVALSELESIRTTHGTPPLGAFLTQNHGEGWLLPECLRLADYGLGKDDRAKRPQVLGQHLGPRFYDWQLVQGADRSREECHLHARNTLGADQFSRLLESLDRPNPLDARTKHDARRIAQDEPGRLDQTTPFEAAETREQNDVSRRRKGSQTGLFE